MALHFERAEYDARRDRLMIDMAEKKLDAVLLFAQESMYWLTGYDTFGFCFFQCLVVKADGSMVLLTRSADLRQARHTSTIENIVLWTDRDGANPAVDLRNLLAEGYQPFLTSDGTHLVFAQAQRSIGGGLAFTF